MSRNLPRRTSALNLCDWLSRTYAKHGCIRRKGKQQKKYCWQLYESVAHSPKSALVAWGREPMKITTWYKQNQDGKIGDERWTNQTMSLASYLESLLQSQIKKTLLASRKVAQRHCLTWRTMGNCSGGFLSFEPWSSHTSNAVNCSVKNGLGCLSKETSWVMVMKR
jgi:hypothetical protein